jgi:hypothetical protein
VSEHEKLLEQGPRVAPEPETAEQRTRKGRMGATAGGVAAGGFALAKLGVIGKVFLWLFAWHIVLDLWRFGGWIGAALAFVGIALALAFFAWRER